MRKLILLLAFIMSGFYSYGQILTPVKWSYAVKRFEKNEAAIFIKATIDKGWHIYSTHADGPVKTVIKFQKDKNYALNGKLIEPTPLSKFEPLLNQTLQYFEQSVVFQQKIQLKNSDASVKGSIHYLVCNNRHCLPPEDVDFNLSMR